MTPPNTIPAAELIHTAPLQAGYPHEPARQARAYAHDGAKFHVFPGDTRPFLRLDAEEAHVAQDATTVIARTMGFDIGKAD